MQTEIRILSRGGQGAVTAAKLLVSAALSEGKYAQMVPNFGQERKGAPVFTFARISDEPVLTHTYVYEPNVVVLFDPFLSDLGIDPKENVVAPATLVANTSQDVEGYPFSVSFTRLGAIDARSVTRETIGDVPPNSAMLGALAKTTGLVRLASLQQAIRTAMQGPRGEKNALCAGVAYERTVVHEWRR
jgi:pyruvate ferredoxin oxidoreductase gamma subunit/2-oxoisovalerate ferredoxin oxidoreductase gamma subunit